MPVARSSSFYGAAGQEPPAATSHIHFRAVDWLSSAGLDTSASTEVRFISKLAAITSLSYSKVAAIHYFEYQANPLLHHLATCTVALRAPPSYCPDVLQALGAYPRMGRQPHSGSELRL